MVECYPSKLDAVGSSPIIRLFQITYIIKEQQFFKENISILFSNSSFSNTSFSGYPNPDKQKKFDKKNNLDKIKLNITK